MRADLARLVAIVPVRSLSGSKSRLGDSLDPEERAELILALLRRTVEAALAAGSLAGVTVVSRDPAAVAAMRQLGAEALLQETDGLNEGLAEARAAIGTKATALVVLPADIPSVDAAAIERLADKAREAIAQSPDRPVVLLVPDHHGSGTNALLVSPPTVVDFHFGQGSRRAHAEAARAAGASYVEAGGPLTFDVDTPDDLLLADLRGLDHEGGR